MTEKAYENQFPQGSWEARLESMMQVRAGAHHFPAFLTKILEQLKKAKPEADTRWLLAAMLAEYIVYRKEIPIKAAPLSESTEATAIDLWVGDYKFVVIDIAPDGREFLVDQQTYLAQKPYITHFFHIQADAEISGLATYWIHSKAEVADWDIKHLETDMYCKPIKDFFPKEKPREEPLPPAEGVSKKEPAPKKKGTENLF
jgi:hypothetical protein